MRKYYFNNATQPGHVTVLDDAPSATDYNQPGDNWHLNVYAVDRSGNVKQNYRDSGTWTGWTSNLQGGCSSSPASAAYGGSHLWVFCRTADANGTIRAKRWNGSTWGSWSNLGTTGFQSGPAATEYNQPGDAYHINVYALGWDGNIYQNYYHVGSGTWSGWTSKGSPSGGCTSAPGTDWRSTTELYIFCRATSGEVWYRKWDSGAWGAWTDMNGSSVTAPGATDYFQPGDTWHLNVYAKQGTATTPDVVQNYKSNGGFLGWNRNLGGSCASAPAASDLPTAPYDLFVFCRWDPGPNSPPSSWNGGIYYRRWDNSAWGGWISLGLHLP